MDKLLRGDDACQRRQRTGTEYRLALLALRNGFGESAWRVMYCAQTEPSIFVEPENSELRFAQARRAL
jgi:hypothetical protein